MDYEKIILELGRMISRYAIDEAALIAENSALTIKNAELESIIESLKQENKEEVINE